MSQIIGSGQPCTFTVEAGGTPEPAYQWRFLGQNIPSATNWFYTIPAAGSNDIGWYDVIVSNRAGTNTSATASLSFCDLKLLAAVYLDGPIGSNYLVQATSAVQPTSWTTLTNVTLNTRPFIYVDFSSATNTKQFYRAVPQ